MVYKRKVRVKKRFYLFINEPTGKEPLQCKSIKIAEKNQVRKTKKIENGDAKRSHLHFFPEKSSFFCQDVLTRKYRYGTLKDSYFCAFSGVTDRKNAMK